MVASEEWRVIPSFPDYEVSSVGRVRVKRILKNQRTIAGYERIELTRSGKAHMVNVHQLVAWAFIGERPEGLQINHINNVRHDNHVANLEYVTAKQNCHHRKVHGTFPSRENNGRAKLTSAQVDEIRCRRLAGEKVKDMAAEFRVHENTIRLLSAGMTWPE